MLSLTHHLPIGVISAVGLSELQSFSLVGYKFSVNLSTTPNTALVKADAKVMFRTTVKRTEYSGLKIDTSRKIVFRYSNWRGETALRTAVPIELWFGSTDWHKEEQWFIKAFDLEKDGERDFALRDIKIIASSN